MTKSANDVPNTMVPARSLGPNDIISVPVEDCTIIEMIPVPGVLANRKSKLIRMKVVPVSGPWAGCEGFLTVESSDRFVLIHKHDSTVSMFKRICQLADKIKSYFVHTPKVKALPAPVESTGPIT